MSTLVKTQKAMAIPTVDLSAFFRDDDEEGRKAATDTISSACRTSGFFRVSNHGVPKELMGKVMGLLKEFFDRPEEDKAKVWPDRTAKAPMQPGYGRQPDSIPDKNEYFMMFKPELGLNAYPADPAQLRPTVDECFAQLTKLALLVADILNDCMGLPPNFIRQYATEQRADVMVAMHYFPATNTDENCGIAAHQDGNFLSLLCQDDLGGLEVLMDDQWISIDPLEGAIIVNVGDIVQVLTNNKFKSALHRVVRRAKKRQSFVFFFNTDGDKRIEPLPQFTTEIGEQPAYRGFTYKEYMALRMKNKTHPPANPEDAIDISHYAISPS